MDKLIITLNGIQELLNRAVVSLSFLAPLTLRLYLVPLFWVAGWNKANSFSDTAAWFGNPDWGLGLPFPELNASLAISAEIGGAVLLALGFATRWACIPLLFTMGVAAATVHLKNGWQVIFDKLGAFPPANIDEALNRLSAAKSILKEHGNYSWLTEHGNFVLSNNGVEYVAAYAIMLLSLLVLGGGKYVSLDYWIAKKCGVSCKKSTCCN